MGKIEIVINGEAYPCQQTMGAMLRFKNETGREVTEIKNDSFSDMSTLLWCCIVSACKHEGKKFDMSLMDFADSISISDVIEWAKVINAKADISGDEYVEVKDEKKS